MSKISQLPDGGNPQAGDKILIARDGDNFWVNGGVVASTAALALVDYRVKGTEDALTLVNGSITALQGTNTATATRLTGIDSSVSAARGVADDALAKAIAATRLPINPPLTRPGASMYFPLLPNYILADMQNATNFSFRSTNGYNGSFMFPFFCDRNVQVSSIKAVANTSGATAAKSYRFFIKNYDMSATTVLDYVYTGNQGTIAATSASAKSILIDNAAIGVLEAGKWYVVGISLQGNGTATADETYFSSAVSYPASNGMYINAAGNIAVGAATLFFPGTSHVTSGAPSNTLAVPYSDARFGTVSMDWAYTTANPRAFTGGSGFAA